MSVDLLESPKQGNLQKCSRECSRECSLKSGCCQECSRECSPGAPSVENNRKSTLESTLGSTFGGFPVLGSLAGRQTLKSRNPRGLVFLTPDVSLCLGAKISVLRAGFAIKCRPSQSAEQRIEECFVSTVCKLETLQKTRGLQALLNLQKSVILSNSQGRVQYTNSRRTGAPEKIKTPQKIARIAWVFLSLAFNNAPHLQTGEYRWERHDYLSNSTSLHSASVTAPVTLIRSGKLKSVTVIVSKSGYVRSRHQ